MGDGKYIIYIIYTHIKAKYNMYLKRIYIIYRESDS